MERRFAGRPAAPGIALGALIPLTAGNSARVASGAAESEADALRSALDAARADLKALIERSTGGRGGHIWNSRSRCWKTTCSPSRHSSAIAAGRAADHAWLDAMQQEIAGYEESDDEYFRARAADLYDIRDRVQAHLTGTTIEAAVPPGAIVAAVDLAPSRFLAIDWSRGGALVLTAGSTTSHVAMLARSRGIPAVMGLGVDLAELSGQALVDAHRGVLIVNPGPAATRAQFDRDAQAAAAATRALAAAAAMRPAVDRRWHADPDHAQHCGSSANWPISIRRFATASGSSEPSSCSTTGKGCRTRSSSIPIYRRITEWAQGRPVTIRTLDAGGDKPIPGLTPTGESNPFLGVRGLRLSFAHPDVFRAQLRALARAATHGDVKIMLPMVTQPHELVAARSMLDAEVAALGRRAFPRDARASGS